MAETSPRQTESVLIFVNRSEALLLFLIFWSVTRDNEGHLEGFEWGAEMAAFHRVREQTNLAGVCEVLGSDRPGSRVCFMVS